MRNIRPGLHVFVPNYGKGVVSVQDPKSSMWLVHYTHAGIAHLDYFARREMEPLCKNCNEPLLETHTPEGRCLFGPLSWSPHV